MKARAGDYRVNSVSCQNSRSDRVIKERAMKQNIYDNSEFFLGYKQLRDSKSGLNEVLEEPAVRELLPALRDKSILDLGCGFGAFEEFALEQEAARILAVDISEKMLDLARERIRDQRVTFVREALEDFVPARQEYDLAIASLCLHYVDDVGTLFARIAKSLKPSGQFVFSIEHPICTSMLDGWAKDNTGSKLHWPVDRYFDEGARVSHWFVDGVIKYHRTVETYVRLLLEAGFEITALLEPRPEEQQVAKRPNLKEEMRRPAFLVIGCRFRA